MARKYGGYFGGSSGGGRPSGGGGRRRPDCGGLCPNCVDRWAAQQQGGGREARRDQAAYGQGSRSGGYGRSSFSMRRGTFDGYPSLSRRRDDGKIDIFYGPEEVMNDEGNIDLNNKAHGHAILKDGRLISKRPPGADKPVFDTGE